MFSDQANQFHNNKLTNLDSFIVNRNLSSNNELANKKYVDAPLGDANFLRFSQTLENYLKLSVGKDINNLAKHDKKQIADTTIINYPNSRRYLLQNWVVKCNDKNKNGKKQNFIKSTKTSSPTGKSRATGLPTIGHCFTNIETSSGNNGNGVFVFFERTDIIQFSNITFYYNRFSNLTTDLLKSMDRFTVQLLLSDIKWSARYNIPKMIDLAIHQLNGRN